MFSHQKLLHYLNAFTSVLWIRCNCNFNVKLWTSVGIVLPTPLNMYKLYMSDGHCKFVWSSLIAKMLICLICKIADLFLCYICFLLFRLFCFRILPTSTAGSIDEKIISAFSITSLHFPFLSKNCLRKKWVNWCNTSQNFAVSWKCEKCCFVRTLFSALVHLSQEDIFPLYFFWSGIICLDEFDSFIGSPPPLLPLSPLL